MKKVSIENAARIGYEDGDIATMTRFTDETKSILGFYEADSIGVRTNLARLLTHGRLAGSGKLVILPVDQGFEHGPARSFAVNPDAYDPAYLYKLAIDAGLSALAAPLGLLESAAERYLAQVPTILKVNSANALAATPDQAVTASVEDALRLGCVAVGFTIYPAADKQFAMMEELREIARHAKSVGLAVVVWSYPRGGMLDKEGETALDIIAYAAHMACLLGAHIVKVKPPSAHIFLPEAKKVYEKHEIERSILSERVRHVVQSCFNGRRLVVFSGGSAKGDDNLLQEVRELKEGGASGSIIGRNAFQRPYAEARNLLDRIVAIYQGKE